MRLTITQNNILPYLGTIGVVLFIGFTMKLIGNFKTNSTTTTPIIENTKTLRHVVLFKFKESSSDEDIKVVEAAFAELPAKIPEIVDFEWGTNNSPEGLEKGFTHCFFLTFKSEADRDTYLPHPDHKIFGDIVSPHLEDVLVVDYWAK
ncbi:MAG: Dabb family protein [Croceivirga sp.]